MKSAVINLKTDPLVKQEAHKVAEGMGMTLSALINGFLKQLIKTKRVEFHTNEKPSEYLIQSIRQSEKDWKKGNTSPPFDNAEDAVAYLEKQGI